MQFVCEKENINIVTYLNQESARTTILFHEKPQENVYQEILKFSNDKEM